MSINEYIWIGVAVAAVIAEIVTCAMFAMWFVIGALAGILLAKLGVMPELQTVFFFVVSFALMYFVRPYLLKWINRRKIAEFAKLSEDEKYKDIYAPAKEEQSTSDGKDENSIFG